MGTAGLEGLGWVWRVLETQAGRVEARSGVARFAWARQARQGKKWGGQGMAGKSKSYVVTVPIAGHAVITVTAKSEDEAIENAIDGITDEHIETWEPIREVNTGNVCHFPKPWDAVAELE